MQRLEVSGVVRHIYASLGFKGLKQDGSTAGLENVFFLNLGDGKNKKKNRKRCQWANRFKFSHSYTTTQGTTVPQNELYPHVTLKERHFCIREWYRPPASHPSTPSPTENVYNHAIYVTRLWTAVRHTMGKCLCSSRACKGESVCQPFLCTACGKIHY